MDGAIRAFFWLVTDNQYALADQEIKDVVRIGIMLRSLDEKGGIGVYSRNIVTELLELDGDNEYVLFYQRPLHIGSFSHYSNVTERSIPLQSKVLWDQVAVPLACWRHNIDVIFHPKFTAPLLAPCKVVMTVHGADWFIPEQAQYYHWLDVRYIRTFMPLYFKKCSTVISVSQLTTDNFNRVLQLPEGKIQTVYFAPARHFKPVTDSATLDRVRQRYHLPQKFIFTLTKRQGDTRKNLGQIFGAYARYYEMSAEPIALVVGGQDAHMFREDYNLPLGGYGQNIIFPGWIEQADMPAVQTLASVYLYPSNLEAFPIPVTEAMACGTPVITSNVNGLREIAGDAAVLVDPENTEALTQALIRVLGDSKLRSTLSSKGKKRAQLFSWDTCARDTLAILENSSSQRSQRKARVS